MATRDYRLGEFEQGTPISSEPLEVLCEDHCGTFVLPYSCRWRDGKWYNGDAGNAIEAKVVGWRAYKLHRKPSFAAKQ